MIQVGDLVGGRDDVACVRLIEPYVAGGVWTQLAGNWESGAIGRTPLRNRRGDEADPAALAILAKWFTDGRMAFASSVTTRSGRTAVVTHAGVTSGWWREYLDEEPDPLRVAERINALPVDVLWHGGEMRGEGDLPAAPLWASTDELWWSWYAEDLPWSQVHGHTVAYDGRTGWLRWVPEELREYAEPAATRGWCRYRPPRSPHSIVGIDPSLWDGSPRGARHALVVADGVPSGG